MRDEWEGTHGLPREVDRRLEEPRRHPVQGANAVLQREIRDLLVRAEPG